MRRFSAFAALTLTLSVCCSQTANSQDAVAAGGAKADRIAVMSVHGSPGDLAETVASVVDGSVQITTDSGTGTIIVRGDENDVRATEALLQRIDRGPQVISVNVTVAVTDTATGKNKIVDEFKLVTLDGVSAKSRFGQEVAVPSSRTVSGRSFTQYSMQSVGTYVQLTPRLKNGSIMLQLEVEKSWVDAAAAVVTVESDGRTAAGQSMPVSRTYSSEVSTALLVKPGEPQSVRALVGGETEEGRVMIVTVTGTVGTESELRARSTVRQAPEGFRPRAAAPRDSRDRAAATDGRTAVPGYRDPAAGRGRSASGDRPSGRDRDQKASDSPRERDVRRPTPSAALDAAPERVEQAASKSRSVKPEQDRIERKAVLAIFSRLDADNSGDLDDEEFARMPKTLQSELKGSKGRLTDESFVNEFLKVLKRRREK